MHRLDRYLLSLLFLLLSLAGLASAQTTTHTTQTENNTSACDGVGSPGIYCNGPFNGMDSAFTYNNVYQPPPGNVSRVPIDTMIYPGNTTKVYAHFMPWFKVCNTSASSYPVGTDGDGDGYVDSDHSRCSTGHIETGYNSDDAETVRAQLDDIFHLSFDGVVINWYGKPQGSCPLGSFCVHDNTTKKVRDDLAARCEGPQDCPLLFTLNVDQGIFTLGSACPNDQNEPKCILSRLKAALDYANGSLSSGNANYFGSAAYLKVGGRPVVSFFIAESGALSQCTSSSPCNLDTGTCSSNSACWTAIWDRLRTHVQGYSNGNPLFVFRNAGGFSHPQSDSGYAWQNHYQNKSHCTGADGVHDSGDTYGLCYLDDFYEESLLFPSKKAWGAGWRGTDNTAAPWGSGQDTPLRCGQAWLYTMKEANFDAANGQYGTSGSYYSMSRQLPYLQVVTWNDYDEGTAMEDGIDNCWSISASVAGATLSWTRSIRNVHPNASTYATENTIDHYAIYDSADGENLTLVAKRPRGQSLVDLCTLALGTGTRTLYVQAVGLPSILNQMSQAVTWTNSGCPTRKVTYTTPGDGSIQLSPVRVAAAASPAATAMEIFLDGSSVYTVNSSSLDTTLPMPAGNHRLTVQAYDALGPFKSTRYIDTCLLNPASPSVTICTPTAGAVVQSPVRVLAGTSSEQTIDLVQIYLDGDKVYEVAADRLDTSIPMTPGTHRLTVQAYDVLNNIFKSTVYVTVE